MKGSDPFLALLTIAIAGTLAGCRSQAPADRIQATYDRSSGELSRLTIDGNIPGKPKLSSHINRGHVTRIDIDEDEDGRLDRWEYYGTARKLEKVGLSRANDGNQDAWAFAGADGRVWKVEVSTRRDGRVNRTEYYEQDQIVRAEEDTNFDGLIDKWETYRAGVLATASFDPARTGKPSLTIDYK